MPARRARNSRTRSCSVQLEWTAERCTPKTRLSVPAGTISRNARRMGIGRCQRKKPMSILLMKPTEWPGCEAQCGIPSRRAIASTTSGRRASWRTTRSGCSSPRTSASISSRPTPPKRMLYETSRTSAPRESPEQGEVWLSHQVLAQVEDPVGGGLDVDGTAHHPDEGVAQGHEVGGDVRVLLAHGLRVHAGDEEAVQLVVLEDLLAHQRE